MRVTIRGQGAADAEEVLEKALASIRLNQEEGKTLPYQFLIDKKLEAERYIQRAMKNMVEEITNIICKEE